MSLRCLWAAVVLFLPACGNPTPASAEETGDGTSTTGGSSPASSTGAADESSSTGEPAPMARTPLHRTMAGGKDHGCRIRGDGSIACWVVGEGAVAPEPPPGTFVHIRAGDLTTCALTEEGGMHCWGAHNLEHSGPWVDVDSMQDNVCALSPEGRVTCWGSLAELEPPHADGFRELMLVEESRSSANARPVIVCGLGADDRVSCWGADLYGEREPWGWTSEPISPLTEAIVMVPEIVFEEVGDDYLEHLLGVVVCGRGETKATCELVRNADPPDGVEPDLDEGDVGAPLVNVEWIDRSIEVAGDETACGRSDDGQQWCWQPAFLTGASANLDFAIVDAAPRSRCALREDDSVECQSPDAPDPVEPPASGVASFDGACALLEDRSLDCWGQIEDFDGLGGWTFSAVAASDGAACLLRDEPAGEVYCRGYPSSTCFVPPGPHVALAVDGNGACGIEADGAVHCWGCFLSELVPGPPGSFDAISYGGGRACALADGIATCWNPETGAVKPAPDTPFVKIVGGEVGTCGLTPDGEVECWPTQPEGMPPGPWTDVAAHDSREVVCGLREDGTARCWGPGSAMFTPPTTPFVALTAASHVCGLTESGAVRCWGSDPWDPLRWAD